MVVADENPDFTDNELYQRAEEVSRLFTISNPHMISVGDSVKENTNLNIVDVNANVNVDVSNTVIDDHIEEAPMTPEIECKSLVAYRDPEESIFRGRFRWQEESEDEKDEATEQHSQEPAPGQQQSTSAHADTTPQSPFAPHAPLGPDEGDRHRILTLILKYFQKDEGHRIFNAIMEERYPVLNSVLFDACAGTKRFKSSADADILDTLNDFNSRLLKEAKKEGASPCTPSMALVKLPASPVSLLKKKLGVQKKRTHSASPKMKLQRTQPATKKKQKNVAKSPVKKSEVVKKKKCRTAADEYNSESRNTLIIKKRQPPVREGTNALTSYAPDGPPSPRTAKSSIVRYQFKPAVRHLPPEYLSRMKTKICEFRDALYSPELSKKWKKIFEELRPKPITHGIELQDIITAVNLSIPFSMVTEFDMKVFNEYVDRFLFHDALYYCCSKILDGYLAPEFLANRYNWMRELLALGELCS